MTTIPASMHTPRLRSCASALAALCATAVSALPTTYAAAIAAQALPTNIVVSNCNDSGAGSLRDAVGKAISDDTIDLTQLACSRISLTTGAIVMQQNNIKLVGPGPSKLAIDGGNVDSILYHKGAGTLRVSGLSIINGNRYSRTSLATGGCVRANSHLRLEDVGISHCKASSGGDYLALGGAVWVQGYAAIVRSVISESSAVSNETGVARGGGVYVAGNLYMRGSTIANNVAAARQSFYSNSGGMTVGHIAHISESLISGNEAGNFGGLNLDGAATISNSTVAGNRAVEIGGIRASAPLYLYNSTVAFNNSSRWATGVGGLYLAAGVFAQNGGILSSTIISNNVNTGAPYATADVTGTVAFSGESNNAMLCLNVCPPDTTVEDPGLRPLRDNGGPTKTLAPTPGPWNRIHGTNRRAAVWDQRGIGFPRMSPGDPIEIGAFQTNSGIVFVNGFN